MSQKEILKEITHAAKYGVLRKYYFRTEEKKNSDRGSPTNHTPLVLAKNAAERLKDLQKALQKEPLEDENFI